MPVLVVVCAEPPAKVRFLDTANRDEHVRERQASSLATQASRPHRSIRCTGHVVKTVKGPPTRSDPFRCIAVYLIDSRNAMASCDTRTPSAMSTTG